MNIEIQSRLEIEKLAKKPFSVPTALISIGDVGSDPPKLQNLPDYLLRLTFDDMELYDLEYETSGSYANRLFSDKQAEQIIDFVTDCRDKIELLICQCEYGVSRSTAIAAAIKQYIDGDGIRFFADNRYHPNIYVFGTTMNAFVRREKEKSE